MKRRDFIKAGLAFTAVPGALLADSVKNLKRSKNNPLVLSTWGHGIPANGMAMPILTKGGTALDAVETGARVPEEDPTSQSVGYGGLPDEQGKVTLDACIMDSHGNAGSVAFLQGIKHPVSVARRVMEKTPHVMLVGEGARQFAVSQGFEEKDLLTEDSRKAWEKWTKAQTKQIPHDTHDTITVLAQDKNGNLAGACTTSGLAFKLHGRVGDSPIIGAGLYVDNEVGSAGATGLGRSRRIFTS